MCLTHATDDAYGDYIDRVIGSKLFRSGIWRWRRGTRVEVMSPALTASGAVRKIGFSLLSEFIMLRCRYVYLDMAVRVEAAGGAA